MIGFAFKHSESSTRCASDKPNKLLETSASSGWTSLLIDHHEGVGHSDIFETHPTQDLTLVVASAGRHELESYSSGRWRLALYQPGSAGLTPPGETARLRWRTPSDHQPFRTLHIYLPAGLMFALADEYRRLGQECRTESLSALIFRDEAVAVHANALLAACREGAPDLYAAGAAQWLLTHLLSRQAGWRHIHEDTRLAATMTDRRLSRVIEYMSTYLDRPLTLDELAREAGISMHHFGRRFREAVGLGPASYLTLIRVERAKLLLWTTDIPIAEVALRCGYSRASAFTTAFHRHAGMSPSDYRDCR